MAYEVFNRSVVRIEEPTVSIVPDGRMAINAAAVRILIELRITTVLLLWDSANRRIAIKAAGKGNKNAFAVSISRGHSGVIRAKSFLSHIGWKAPQRVRLPTTWNEGGKMFEVTLPIEYLGPQKGADPRRKLIGL
jgi:hypothetical protein